MEGVNMDVVKKRIIDIVQQSVSEIYSDVKVTESSHLVNDLGFDSITLMQMVIEIEEAFDIEMDDAQYENIIEIKELILYVKQKINKEI